MTLQLLPKEVLFVIYNMLSKHNNGLVLTCKHAAHAIAGARDAAVRDAIQQRIDPYLGEIISAVKVDRKVFAYTHICNPVGFMIIGRTQWLAKWLPFNMYMHRTIQIYLDSRGVEFIYDNAQWRPSDEHKDRLINIKLPDTSEWTRIVRFIEKYVPVLHRELLANTSVAPT